MASASYGRSEDVAPATAPAVAVSDANGAAVAPGEDWIRITFSAQATSTLAQLMNDTGKSVDEIIRDALTVYLWIEQARASKSRFAVERSGKLFEVLFP